MAVSTIRASVRITPRRSRWNPDPLPRIEYPATEGQNIGILILTVDAIQLELRFIPETQSKQNLVANFVCLGTNNVHGKIVKI